MCLLSTNVAQEHGRNIPGGHLGWAGVDLLALMTVQSFPFCRARKEIAGL